MITIRLIGDERLVARLDALPGRLRDSLARTVTRLGLELQRKVQDEKLSRRVQHPGSKLPERSFLRSARAEMAPQIEEELRVAAAEALR